MYETWWLANEDVLVQVPVKKGVLNIKLSNRPTVHYCQGKEKSHRHRLSYEVKCLIVVHAMDLMEPLGDDPCFSSLNLAIIMAFSFENTLYAKNIVGRFRRNEGPSLCEEKGLKFGCHVLVPLQVFICLSEELGLINNFCDDRTRRG